MTRHLSPSGIGVRHADHCADWLRRRLRPGHGQIRRPLWYLAGAARSPPVADSGVGGAGAMGRVYLGRSTAGRLVAVKTIKIELADEAGFRARFAHEVAAARRVSG